MKLVLVSEIVQESDQSSFLLRYAHFGADDWVPKLLQSHESHLCPLTYTFPLCYSLLLNCIEVPPISLGRQSKPLIAEMSSSKVFEADPERKAAAPPSSATAPPPTPALSIQNVAPKTYRLDDQTQRLPFARLMTVYLCLATCVFVSFLDVNSTTTSLPVIAKALNAQNSITWAGASYLIAYAAFQVLYGRMSDIFGRKPILLLSMGMLIFGDILCGFAKNATWLYVCRALSGIGGGGITSLVLIIVSDMVSLKERGKYQGMLSVAIGLGSATGPFVSAGLLATGPGGWRWAFWVPAMLTTAAIPCLVFLLPTKPITGSWWDKVHKIDWLGLSSSVIAMLFILVCSPFIAA